METIVSIDIKDSTRLTPILEKLDGRFSVIAKRALVPSGSNEGEDFWRDEGDGLVTAFKEPDAAISASLRFLNELAEFNRQEALRWNPVFVRIGMDLNHQDTIWKVPKGRRSELMTDPLNRAAKLQKSGPVGKLSITKSVYDHPSAVSFRPLFRPSSDFASFVSKTRRLMPQEERVLVGLSNQQQHAVPPICALNWQQIRPDRTLKDLRTILREDLVVVFGDTSSQSRGILQSAATSDAVGVMEALSLMQHNELKVGIDEWQDTAELAASRNVLVVGSGAANLYGFVVNDIFEPMRFVKDRVNNASPTANQIVAGTTSSVWFGQHAEGSEHTGFVVVARNPFNLEKTLVWLAGISGMGTQAASTFLKELITGQTSVDTRAIGVVVKASAGKGAMFDPADYFRKWRISAFDLHYWIDAEGRGYRISPEV